MSIFDIDNTNEILLNMDMGYGSIINGVDNDRIMLGSTNDYNYHHVINEINIKRYRKIKSGINKLIFDKTLDARISENGLNFCNYNIEVKGKESCGSRFHIECKSQSRRENKLSKKVLDLLYNKERDIEKYLNIADDLKKNVSVKNLTTKVDTFSICPNGRKVIFDNCNIECEDFTIGNHYLNFSIYKELMPEFINCNIKPKQLIFFLHRKNLRIIDDIYYGDDMNIGEIYGLDDLPDYFKKVHIIFEYDTIHDPYYVIHKSSSDWNNIDGVVSGDWKIYL